MNTEADVVTAPHEAAHAVVNYRVTGFAGEPVSIVPRPDVGSLGEADGGISDSFNEEHMEGRILSRYAGGHAQQIIDASCGFDGCDTDDEIAADLLRRFGWESREAELRQRTRALIHQHCAEIQAVVAELLRVQVLNDTEVEIIADAITGDPEADLAQYRANFGDQLDAFRATVRATRGAELMVNPAIEPEWVCEGGCRQWRGIACLLSLRRNRASSRSAAER